MNSASIAIDGRLLTGSHTGDRSYWRGLLWGLAQLETDLRLFVLTNSEDLSEIPKAAHIVPVFVPGSGRWWSLAKFPTVARKLGCRAIHTQYNLSPLAGARGITTIHDVSFFIGPEWFQPRDLAILQRFVPLSASRASKVITVSETSRTEIEAHIPQARGKTIVTYNALDPFFNSMSRDDAVPIMASYGVSQPYALTVGTRWPRKNQELAVRAVEALPDTTALNLAVIGKEGWGSDRTSDRVRFTGYLPDEHLPAAYAAASVYLAPAFHEGFGIPLLESWASGCPVICSTGGAMPEVAGEAAEIVPGFEPHAWAATIERLIGDSGTLEAMRRRGKDRLKAFSWVESAKKTLEVYREVAQG